DPGRRSEIEGAQLEAIDAHLNPLYQDLVGTQHHAVRELGYGSYREMCVQCKGFDLDGLHAQTSAFTTRTYSSYRTIIDEQAREVLGFGLADVRRSDMSRFD